MKKKTYEKPQMRVYKMRQRTQLLTESNGQGGVQDYQWNTPSEE